MQLFTAIVALALAVAANAASTPVRRDGPPATLPKEPGILTFRNDHCGYDDAQAEGVFAPYSALDKYCAIVPLFHSYINYSPDGAPLPYDVYIDKWTNPCQNLTTAVKLTTTNTCVKVADAGTETQWEYLFLGKYGKY